MVPERRIMLQVFLEHPEVSIDPEDYLHLALKIAYKYRSKHSYEEIKDTEVYSIACEELIRAAIAYKPERGDFSRYAWKIMTNGILQKMRHQKRKKRSASFAELTENQWNNVVTSEASVSHLHLLPILFKHDDQDTHQDREDKNLLIEHYINNKKINILAEVLDVTRMTIYKRMQRAIEKLKIKLEGLIDLEPAQGVSSC